MHPDISQKSGPEPCQRCLPILVNHNSLKNDSTSKTIKTNNMKMAAQGGGNSAGTLTCGGRKQ